MSYIPPERTPPQPPKVWKSETERRVWFAKNGIPGVGLKSGGSMPILYTKEQIDEMHRKSISQRLLRLIVAIIDWLNRVSGADTPKPKEKTNGEQMATLSELFEGYEDNEEHPDWKLACAMDRYFENKIKASPPPLPPYPPTRDITRM